MEDEKAFIATGVGESLAGYVIISKDAIEAGKKITKQYPNKQFNLNIRPLTVVQ